MFLLKKLIAPFFLPLPLCLWLGGLGLLLLVLMKRRRAGTVLVGASLVMSMLLGQRAGGDLLLAPIERRHPPFDRSLLASDSLGTDSARVDYVVVLGGGHADDPRFPATSRIGESSLFRLVEGIRIHRTLPGSRLLLSGGDAFGGTPNAVVMAEVARSLGIADSVLVLETESKDTKDQARLLEPLLRDKVFILVTEASHMPRSVAMFRKVGLEPTPAPARFRVLVDDSRSPGAGFPSSHNLHKSERAFYELLGSVWAWLRGQT